MGISVKSTRLTLRRTALILVGCMLAACQAGPLGGNGPSINTRAPVPVALLVPYGSGGAGEEGLARSLENAARLAIADLEGVTIELSVYPTAGDANQAAAAAVQAVNEGAKIILGPVFGDAANSAGVAVASRNVNVLAFSNNTRIAGGNVFVLGNTFENTATRLIDFGVSQGNASIAVVHPTTTVGEIGRDAVLSAISNTRASSVGQVGYEASQQGVVSAIPTIADLVRDASADTIFFTSDTLGGLPLLTQMLPENRISPSEVQFMGLTRWDIPAGTLDLPGVQNGLFALPDPALTARFAQRYESAYGSAPHPIAGLAYDGIAAIGALVASGNSSALTRGALTQSSGFRGVNGVFRLMADGTNERGLAVARIVDRGVTIVSPAPTGFGSAGF